MLKSKVYVVKTPDEDGCRDQHDRQVDCDTGLKVEIVEVSRGQSYEEEQEGWKVGCQKFINESPLKCDLHLQAICPGI